MTEFSPGRAQDASSTIAGFVYQAQRTIQRWLDLEDPAELQLECGEDIDVVSKALIEGGEEQGRLLEQVKKLQARITLKSRPSVFSVAGFLEHRAKNPEIDLRFCFTTTADVGRELPSAMPSGLPGIVAWEKLRQGRVDDATRDTLLAAIRSVMADARRPERVSDEAWRLYSELVGSGDDDQLADLIRRFEWLVGQSGDASIHESIISDLSRRYGLDSGTSAPSCYLRLFVRVLDVMSQPGAKILTATERDSVVALPPLEEEDRRRVDALAKSLGTHEAHWRSLETRVARLERTHPPGAMPQVEMQPSHVPGPTKPPLLVQHLSQRADALEAIYPHANGAVWIMLTGSIGMGKTHLAALLAQRLGEVALWVRLRDMSAGEARQELQAVMLSGAPGYVRSAEALYDEVCARLPARSVIVLDDVPRLDGGDPMSSRLSLLATSCQRHGAVLLTTSSAPLPVRLREQHGQLIREITAPALSDHEVLEILTSWGAGDEWRDKRSTFIKTICNGHPTLVSAAARYLVERNWVIDERALNELLGGAYQADLTEGTVGRLVDAVTAEKCRELLYRLALSSYPLTRDQIGSVARVEPGVPNHLECVAALSGMWLQQDSAEQFVVSPLVRSLGPRQLPDPTSVSVNLTLGELLLAQGPLDPYDVGFAVTHLTAGEDPARAAAVLGMACRSLSQREDLTTDFGLLAFFPPSRVLPPGLSASMGVHVRAAQLALAGKLDRDPAPYLSSMEQLADECESTDSMSALGASMQVALLSQKVGVQTAARWLLKAMKLWDAVGATEKKQIAPSVDRAGLVCIVGYAAHDWDGVWAWLEALEELPQDAKQLIWRNRNVRELCMILIDRIWTANLDAEGGSRREWQGVVSDYERLLNWARERDNMIAAACAVRAMLVIRGEYLRDIREVEGLAAQALEWCGEDPTCTFIVSETVGQQFLIHGNAGGARSWFKAAMDCDFDGYEARRFYGLLGACEASSAFDAMESTGFGHRAAEQLESLDGGSGEMQFLSQIHLAVAYWDGGDREASFDYFEKAVVQLLRLEESPEAKARFVLVGHCAGYYASVSATGSPPSYVEGGGEYVAPEHHMFRGFNRAVVSRYQESMRYMIPAQVAAFGRAVGRAERAAIWAREAYEIARDKGNPTVIAVVAPQVVSGLLAAGEFADAFDVAMVGGQAFVAAKKEREAGRDVMRPDFEFDPLFVQQRDDLRARAEELGLRYFLLPACFRFLRGESAGKAEARRDVASCRDIIANKAGGLLLASMWTAVADLFAHALEDDTFERYWERVKALETTEHTKDIKASGYLLSAVHERSPPAAVLQGQLACMDFVIQLFGSSSEEVQGIVIPQIVGYWEDYFSESRFLFTAPQVVRQSLEEARELAPEARMKRTLSAVAFGLGVSIGEDTATWLRI